MIVVIIILATFIITCFIFNISKESNEDRGFRAITFLFVIMLSILLGVIINSLTTPTIEDYIHGKVKVKINQIYENGEVVRCDTNYYKL